MSQDLYKTRELLKKLPHGEAIPAVHVIDLLIKELGLVVDGEAIARVILWSLHEDGFLCYRSNLFFADTISLTPEG